MGNSNSKISISGNWLKGKTVIITGASGGMGSGIAETLIKKHGCFVVGVDISKERTEEFIERLGPTYAEQFTYKLFDVSVRENWENFAKELEEENIHPSVLINNAGILPRFKRFDRVSYEEIDRAMNINFYSCVYSVKTFLPILLKENDPAIINVASSATLMSLAGTSMYSASKSAVKGLTEAIRIEYKNKMYVGLVCPGFTKTGIFAGQGDTEDRTQKLLEMVSSDCDVMVRNIVFGIEHKLPLMIYGFDAHAMSVVNRLMPTKGGELFSAAMKASKAKIFDEVFKF